MTARDSSSETPTTLTVQRLLRAGADEDLRPEEGQEFDIATPASSAAPPPSSLGDWDEEKERLEDFQAMFSPRQRDADLYTERLYLWVCSDVDCNCQCTWHGKVRTRLSM